MTEDGHSGPVEWLGLEEGCGREPQTDVRKECGKETELARVVYFDCIAVLPRSFICANIKVMLVQHIVYLSRLMRVCVEVCWRKACIYVDSLLTLTFGKPSKL